MTKPSFEDTAIRIGREDALKLVAAGLVEKEQASANLLRAREEAALMVLGYMGTQRGKPIALAFRAGKDDAHMMVKHFLKLLNELNPSGKTVADEYEWQKYTPPSGCKAKTFPPGVKAGDRVEIMTAVGGSPLKGPAGDWRWDHWNKPPSGGDITKWRRVKP